MQRNINLNLNLSNSILFSRHRHLRIVLQLHGCKHTQTHTRRGAHSASSYASATTSTTTTTRRGAHSAAATTKNAAFTSFFFHNAQWMTSGSGSGSTQRRRSLRGNIAELAFRPMGVGVASSSASGAAVASTSASSSATAATTMTTTSADAPNSNSNALAGYKQIENPTGLKLLKIYNQLAKSNLTILVVLTSMSSVALSPFPATLPVLLATALGTVLCSASANTLNQLQEVPFDAQMARTRMRPFVRRAITPLHGLVFAGVAGVAGPVILWGMTNPLTVALGLANVVLYAGVYTWMKRKSVWNTWVGAVVGGIPPLMGWTACGGRLWPETWTLDAFPMFLPQAVADALSLPVPVADLTTLDNPLAPFAFFMFLFSWQFFHFMPLSHIVRHSYTQAGYHMLSIFNPRKNALVALRHTLLLIPICSLLFPISGLTTWWFAVTTLVPNLVCARGAWRFWRRGGEREARVLFQQSLWYLPVVMGLMMFHKQGMEWLVWLGIVDKEEEGVKDVDSKAGEVEVEV